MEIDKLLKLKELLREELNSRIEAMRLELNSAESCLSEDDFIRCARSLEAAAVRGSFDNMFLGVLETMSGPDIKNTVPMGGSQQEQ